MTDYLVLAPHQREAVRVLLARPQCAVFALPGTGKTAIALSVLRITRARALVIAPLATALTSWPGEIARWAQFSGLDYAIAHGRDKAEAFGHDVTIINPEGIKWLHDHPDLLAGKDTLIVDESPRFRTWSSKSTKMLRNLAPRFARRHILTGTPVSKTLLGWFAQQYIVDLGESFGPGICKFRAKHFYPGGYKNHEWIPFDTTSERMSRMAAGRYHVAENLTHQTPGLHYIDERVSLPDAAMAVYREMARKMIVRTDDGEVVADDLRQKFLKLRQIASGALYTRQDDGTRVTSEIHTAKIDRVAQIVEEYGGPVVIGYIYRFELDMLRRAFRGKKCAEINGQTTERQKASAQRNWEAGRLDLLFVHPRSGGHGLNLHHGGRCLIHLSLPDDPELYEQLNARIDRMGAQGAGYVYRIMADKTIERDVVLPRLLRRGRAQELLIEHCKKTQSDCT